jgi:outer membrane protein assembly factor BamB
MKAKALPFFSLVILLSMLLSACGAPQAASWPGITTTQDTTYVSYSQLYSVRTSDGSLQWKYPEKPEGSGMFAAPAVGTDLVVVGDYSNNLHAVNPKTGALLWKFENAKARYIAQPLITDKLVLAPSTDHYLYALNFQGTLVGKFEADSALWSQPLYDGKTIYLASLNHKLYALNPSQIETALWKVDVGGAIVSTPALDNKGILYVGTLAKEVVAVDSQSQKILWRAPTNEEVWSSPVIKDGTLYIASKTGTVYALNTADGTLVWKTDIGGTVTSKGALTTAGVVFISVKDKNNGDSEDSGDVIMLDYAKGSKLWTSTIKSLLYGDPASTPNQILVGLTRSSDKLLTVFDFTGKELWSLPLPK